MGDLWEELNNSIPTYFETLITSYQLKAVKLSRIKTALVGKNYALVISLDRFHADIDYFTRDDERKIVKYNIGNFLAESYGEEDRVNLVEGNTAKEMIINNLIIISQGLENKWETLLSGKKEWLKKYRHSKWFSKVNIIEDEKILDSMICD